MWWFSYLNLSPASCLLFCPSLLTCVPACYNLPVSRKNIERITRGYRIRTFYTGQRGLCGAEEFRWRRRVLSLGFVSGARWRGCVAEGPTAAKQPSGVTGEQPDCCCPTVTAYLRLWVAGTNLTWGNSCGKGVFSRLLHAGPLEEMLNSK